MINKVTGAKSGFLSHMYVLCVSVYLMGEPGTGARERFPWGGQLCAGPVIVGLCLA